jgi:hypothetical protein
MEDLAGLREQLRAQFDASLAELIETCWALEQFGASTPLGECQLILAGSR